MNGTERPSDTDINEMSMIRKQYSQIVSSLDLSRSDVVEALHTRLCQSRYYRLLTGQRGVSEALKQLELSFQEKFKNCAVPMDVPSDQVDRLKVVCRKERELRLVLRYAELCDARSIVKEKKELREQRNKAEKYSRALKNTLQSVLQDRHFLQCLVSGELNLLKTTYYYSAKVEEILGKVKTSNIYKNRAKYTDLKLIFDDLALICFQTYLHCDEAIVRGLLLTAWSPDTAAIEKRQIEEMIKSALDRKISDFIHRTSEEPFSPVNFQQLWNFDPPITLDPPWLLC